MLLALLRFIFRHLGRIPRFEKCGFSESRLGCTARKFIRRRGGSEFKHALSSKAILDTLLIEGESEWTEAQLP